MSFKLGLNGVQELLVLALMMVFVFAVFYSDIEFMNKVGITVLVFGVLFLAGLAGQVLKQEEKRHR